MISIDTPHPARSKSADRAVTGAMPGPSAAAVGAARAVLTDCVPPSKAVLAWLVLPDCIPDGAPSDPVGHHRKPATNSAQPSRRCQRSQSG